MNAPQPLETLYEQEHGMPASLPAELAALYGPLRLPAAPEDRPYVIANFVTSLDGVVSLGIPGQSGGRPISGNNPHDRAVMGLLRALVDAVVVGAGTLRAVPQHRWTPAHVCPSLLESYQALRATAGKEPVPLTVIVTASGSVDLALPVFRAGEAPVLLVTTLEGGQHLGTKELPPSVHLEVVSTTGRLQSQEVLGAVRRMRTSTLVLVEGGPHLLGDFLADRCLDELFLTLSPQVAGRNVEINRPSLVAGHQFAPDEPLWSRLVSLKRAGSHLFLRYALEQTV